MKVQAVRQRLVSSMTTNTTQRIFYPPGFGVPSAAILISTGCAFTSTVGTASSGTYADQNITISLVGRDARSGAGLSSFCHTLYNRQGQTTEVIRSGHSTTLFNNWRFISGTSYGSVTNAINPRFQPSFLEFSWSRAAVPTFDQNVICIFFGGNGFTAGVGTFSALAVQDSGVGLSFYFPPKLIIGVNNTEAGSGFISNTQANGGIVFGIVGNNPIGNSFSPANTVSSLYSIFAQLASGAGSNNRSGIGTDLWLKNNSASGAEATVPSTASGNAITNLSWAGSGISVWKRNSTGVASAINSFMGMSFDEPYKYDYFFSPSSTGTTYINLGFVPQFILGCSIGATALQVQGDTGTGDTQQSVDSITFWTAQGPSTLQKFDIGNGTITTTSGLTQLSGTATSFFGFLSEGDYLYDSQYNFVGIVSNVTSNLVGLFKTGASLTLSGSTYFARKYSQLNVYFGGDDKASGTTFPFGGAAQTAIQFFDKLNSTVIRTLSNGEIATLDGSPGFYINFDLVSSPPKLNWYLAFGAEQRQRRRATG